MDESSEGARKSLRELYKLFPSVLVSDMAMLNFTSPQEKILLVGKAPLGKTTQLLIQLVHELDFGVTSIDLEVELRNRKKRYR